MNLGIHELKPGILNDIKLDMGFYIQAADFLSKPFYYVPLVNQQKKIIGKWKNFEEIENNINKVYSLRKEDRGRDVSF